VVFGTSKLPQNKQRWIQRHKGDGAVGAVPMGALQEREHWDPRAGSFGHVSARAVLEKC